MPSPRKQTDAEPDADTAHARRCASPRRGRRHRRSSSTERPPPPALEEQPEGSRASAEERWHGRTSARQAELRLNIVETARRETGQDLRGFLRLFGLERYHARLLDFGVELVPDLLVLEDGDFEELRVKPLHVRRFTAAMEGIASAASDGAHTALSQAAGRWAEEEALGWHSAAPPPPAMVAGMSAQPQQETGAWREEFSALDASAFEPYGLGGGQMGSEERAARTLFAEFDGERSRGRLEAAQVHAALCALGLGGGLGAD